MAGETFDDRVGVDHLKTFAQQRNAGCRLHLLDMRHVGGAQDHAEHQPGRHFGLGAQLMAHLSGQERLMTLRPDFTSQDYFRNPAAAIEKLRSLGPVVEVRFPIIGKVWATTTQALADQVLKDTGTFTIRQDDGNVAGLRWWMPGIVRTLANSMLSMDEPDHKRLRDIVDEAFRRRAVLDMEPHIQATGRPARRRIVRRRRARPICRALCAKTAAVGDLRTARAAARRPAEIHGLGLRLHPLHRRDRISRHDAQRSSR